MLKNATRRRTRHVRACLFILVLVLAVSAALVAPRQAAAYTGPNPVLDFDQWDAVRDVVEDPIPSGASQDARDALWRTKVFNAQLPNPPQQIPLPSSPSASRSWRAFGNGGGPDRFLQVDIALGTTSSHAYAYGTLCGVRWHYRLANTTDHHGVFYVPYTGWYLVWDEQCNSAYRTDALSTSPPTGYAAAVAAISELGTQVTATNNATVKFIWLSQAAMLQQVSFVSETAYTSQSHDWYTTFTLGSITQDEQSQTAADIRSQLLSGGPGSDFEMGWLVDDDWDGPDDETWLNAFAPELRFHPNEFYRPSNATIATDTHQTDSPAHANTLEVLEEPFNQVIASANQTDPQDHLTLSYLGTALDNSYIRMPNWFGGDDSQSALLDYEHAIVDNPEYENVAYGRVVPAGDDEPAGTLILQYWFFYYYNPKNFTPIGGGEHEGDWEMVQVRVTVSGSPISASYTSHTGGEKCLWDTEVSKNAEGRMVVWPALGSHANYFFPHDEHSVVIAGVDLGDDETATAQAFNAVTPEIVNITGDLAQDWMYWGGKWGSSGDEYPVIGGVFTSPPSPGAQDSWAPYVWEASEDVHPCTVP